MFEYGKATGRALGLSSLTCKDSCGQFAAFGFSGVRLRILLSKPPGEPINGLINECYRNSGIYHPWPERQSYKMPKSCKGDLD